MLHAGLQGSPVGLAPVKPQYYIDKNPFIGFLPFLDSPPFSATSLAQDHLPNKLLALKSLPQGLLLLLLLLSHFSRVRPCATP